MAVDRQQFSVVRGATLSRTSSEGLKLPAEGRDHPLSMNTRLNAEGSYGYQLPAGFEIVTAGSAETPEEDDIIVCHVDSPDVKYRLGDVLRGIYEPVEPGIGNETFRP